MGAAPALNVYSDFYFPDGNIVLDVVEDSATTRFRVHKSLLSRNSLFFAGMFDIPQPPEKPSELVDGCPVINLTGDSVGDWIIIFGALYNVYVSKFLGRGRHTNFSQIFQSNSTACSYGCSHVASREKISISCP